MNIHDKARQLAAQACKPLTWGYQELQRRGQEARKRKRFGTLQRQSNDQGFGLDLAKIRLPYAD